MELFDCSVLFYSAVRSIFGDADFSALLEQQILLRA